MSHNGLDPVWTMSHILGCGKASRLSGFASGRSPDMLKLQPIPEATMGQQPGLSSRNTKIAGAVTVGVLALAGAWLGLSRPGHSQDSSNRAEAIAQAAQLEQTFANLGARIERTQTGNSLTETITLDRELIVRNYQGFSKWLNTVNASEERARQMPSCFAIQIAINVAYMALLVDYTLTATKNSDHSIYVTEHDSYGRSQKNIFAKYSYSEGEFDTGYFKNFTGMDIKSFAPDVQYNGHLQQECRAELDRAGN